MSEWRYGQLMDDDDLERLYQMSEMQKVPAKPKEGLLNSWSGRFVILALLASGFCVFWAIWEFYHWAFRGMPQ